MLWKQTEWHVYKYGCLHSGQASPPAPRWPRRFVAEPCNFREWGEKMNQSKMIKDRSAVWPSCKVFLLFIFLFFVRRQRPNRMYTTKILNKTWSDKSQTCRKYRKGQKRTLAIIMAGEFARNALIKPQTNLQSRPAPSPCSSNTSPHINHWGGERRLGCPELAVLVYFKTNTEAHT